MQSVNAPNNAEARRTKVQEGDLLISITADLGRTGVVTKEIAEHGTYINQHLICIRLNKARSSKESEPGVILLHRLRRNQQRRRRQSGSLRNAKQVKRRRNPVR